MFANKVLFIDLDQEGKHGQIQAGTWIAERLLDKLHEPSVEHRPGTQDSFSQLSVQITRLQTLAPSCVLSPAQCILNYFLYNERASVVEL